MSIVTLDNASSNDTCVGILKAKLNSRKCLILNGEFFHIRCGAHILNLIVQEGLKSADEIVEKIRECVRYVRGSQSRREKFLQCVTDLSLDTKRGLKQDLPTRWNSTFLMLSSALYFRTALEHLELTDSNFKTCPSTFEWERVEQLCKFLKPFYELTCLFSGTKYPTANLFFPSLLEIFWTLKEMCESNDEDIRRVALRMKIKFEKYWTKFNEILAIAAIFYPHFKFWGVQFAYKKLYGNDEVGEAHIANIRKKLFDLYNEYVSKSSSSSGLSSSSQVSSSQVSNESEILRCMKGNRVCQV